MDVFNDHELEKKYSKYFGLISDLIRGRFFPESPYEGSRVEDGILYKTNRYGFRSNEETRPTKLLTAGCSMTFGIGVPESDTWPAVFSRLSGCESDFTNIGIPGASIQTVCRTIYDYIQHYGKPKTLLVLVPGLDRTFVGMDKSVIFDENQLERIDSHSEHISMDVLYNFYNLNYAKYSRAPHIWQEVVPIDHAIVTSILAIKHLELYCQAADIELVWSTWDHGFNHVASNSKFYNFCSAKDILYNKDGSWVNCHVGLKTEENAFHYDHGADASPHWGTHEHLHFAELMVERLKDVRS